MGINRTQSMKSAVSTRAARVRRHLECERTSLAVNPQLLPITAAAPVDTIQLSDGMRNRCSCFRRCLITGGRSRRNRQ